MKHSQTKKGTPTGAGTVSRAGWALVVLALRVPLRLASRATWLLQAAESWAVRRRECARLARRSQGGQP